MEGDSRGLGGKSHDAVMMDVGGKDRPPGDPPDVSQSWAKKVAEGNAGGIPDLESFVDEKFILDRMRIEFPDGEDGEPAITIGNEVLEAMNKLWKNCMLVKVLGRSVPLAVLSKKIRELWKPSGALHVMDLPRHFFMVRFGSEEEYLAALTGGPWRVFGSYLMVQAWAPEFDPMKDEIVTTPVWIRMTGLPFNLYHPTILFSIANSLGKPIKVDTTTLKFERARFARVCVEVNLKKPLKGTLTVNGERYFVSYEGLTNICSVCGLYGHLAHNCPRVKAAKAVVVVTQPEAPVTNSGERDPLSDGFVMVEKSGKRLEQQRRKVVNPNGNAGGGLGNNRKALDQRKDLGIISLSNSFGRLQENLENTMIEANAGSSGSNKENEPIANELGKVVRDMPGQGIKFGAHGPVGKEGSNGPLKDNRPWGTKGASGTGPKPKLLRQNKPTRGLVFGSTQGEIELSESGKRMRVEKPMSGRLGGRFVNERNGLSLGTEIHHGGLETVAGSSCQLPQTMEQTEGLLPVGSAEMVVGSHVV
ncbi:putative transcription factor interactor and regulator CCHC(Zn) family [Arabidopsis thaliana]